MIEANYQQVRFLAHIVPIECSFLQYDVDSAINLSVGDSRKQVTSKLDHAHTGIYFTCFGAVAGSSGLEGIGNNEVPSSNLGSSSSETRCPARDSGFLLFWGRN